MTLRGHVTSKSKSRSSDLEGVENMFCFALSIKVSEKTEILKLAGNWTPNGRFGFYNATFQ